MSEQCPDGLRCNPQELRQAMAVHTRKITDACRDKDCVEDLRVYLTTSSQQTLEEAGSVRVRSAQLLYTYMDVEPVAFDRNHYCIDITFYYRILADAIVGTNRPAALTGLAAFSKRAVLCGEDSRAHIFTSDAGPGELEAALPGSHNRPTAVVEAVATNSPGVFSKKLREKPQFLWFLPLFCVMLWLSFRSGGFSAGSEAGRGFGTPLPQFPEWSAPGLRPSP